MPELLERTASTPDQSLARLGAPVEVDERSARTELRRQIAKLEGDLGELFASAFPRRGIEWSVAPADGPRILGVGELEEIRDALAGRLQRARRVLALRGEEEQRKRELLEQMLIAPERYRWAIISNEDIGEPGCRHWHSRPRYGLLGMLMGWWRVRVSSGCPLFEGR
jgi:hypothetical protein